MVNAVNRPPSESGDSTSPSLLEQVQAQDAEAWQRLADLYGPLVYYWCRRFGLKPADASDVFQDVFSAVLTAIGGFRRRDGGAFRGWLWTITRNKIRDHYRKLGAQGEAVGGTDACRRLGQVPDEEPDASDEGPDRDEINGLLHRGLQLVRAEFEQRTWEAFWRVTVEGQSTSEVADDLGVSANAVRQAKSRVLRRLRAELGDLSE
jgi:RNA polymerase sigma-70 factor (ECF subfamily)